MKKKYVIGVRWGGKQAFFSFDNRKNRSEFIEDIKKELGDVEYITTEMTNEQYLNCFKNEGAELQ